MSSGIMSWGSRTDFNSSNTTNSQPEYGSVVMDLSGNSYSFELAKVSSNMKVFDNSDAIAIDYYFSNANEYSNVVIIKRDPLGNVIWYTRMSCDGDIKPTCLEVDSTGSVYVGGYFFFNSLDLAVTFTSYLGSTITLSKVNQVNSGFLAKINIEGDWQWAISPILSTTETPGGVWSLRKDSNDNLYVLTTSPGSGTSYDLINYDESVFRSNISGSSSGQSTWLIKYNSSGTIQWATRCCEGGQTRGLTVVLDNSNNIYIGGKLYTATTYTPWQVNGSSDTAASTGSIVATTAVDGFIIKYNNSGICQWSSAITGSSTIEQHDNEYPLSLAVSNSSLYVSMRTRTTAGYNIKINNSGSGTTIASGIPISSGILFKLNSTSGAYSWYIRTVKNTGTLSYFSCVGIDSSENVLVSGLYNYDAILYDASNNQKSLPDINGIANTLSFNGFIADFRVYAQVLTIDHVNTLYNYQGKSYRIYTIIFNLINKKMMNR